MLTVDFQVAQLSNDAYLQVGDNIVFIGIFPGIFNWCFIFYCESGFSYARPG